MCADLVEFGVRGIKILGLWQQNVHLRGLNIRVREGGLSVLSRRGIYSHAALQDQNWPKYRSHQTGVGNHVQLGQADKRPGRLAFAPRGYPASSGRKCYSRPPIAGSGTKLAHMGLAPRRTRRGLYASHGMFNAITIENVNRKLR